MKKVQAVIFIDKIIQEKRLGLYLENLKTPIIFRERKKKQGNNNKNSLTVYSIEGNKQLEQSFYSSEN